MAYSQLSRTGDISPAAPTSVPQVAPRASETAGPLPLAATVPRDIVLVAMCSYNKPFLIASLTVYSTILPHHCVNVFLCSTQNSFGSRPVLLAISCGYSHCTAAVHPCRPRRRRYFLRSLKNIWSRWDNAASISSMSLSHFSSSSSAASLIALFAVGSSADRSRLVEGLSYPEAEE